MRKIALLLVTLTFAVVAANAQQNPQVSKYLALPQNDVGHNPYGSQFSVGGRLKTNGWGGFLELGKKKSEFITNLYQFEFAETKSPKEDKSARGTYDAFGYPVNMRPYIYGKRNNFYQVKLSFGQSRLIGGKGNKNGVAVSAIYAGGISIGLEKPYYLEVYDTTNLTTETIKYSQANESKFLDPSAIVQGGGLFKGWNELTIVPGIQAHTGIRFDWAAFNETISALEVGVNAEYYTQKVPIAIKNKEKQFFINAYVSVQFGKRW